MIFNPEHLDYDIFEITSSVPLQNPPDLTVYPHGKTDNKDILTYTSTLIPGETMKYRVMYPKQTGFGDVDLAVVKGTDVCGVYGESDGKFDKEVISQKDIILFKNVINPDQGERTRIAYNIYGGTKVTVKIYTRNGALIKTLVDETATVAGQGETIWDGKNSDGATVTSGVYIVVVETDYYTAKDKIAVVR
jgi:hypothetical protein